MAAEGYTGGDPRKVDVAGDTMTGPLVLTDGSPAASEDYVAAHAGGGAVTSVNGETGVVVLDAADVGADPTGTAVAHVAAHVAASDPHGDRAAATSALNTHAALLSAHGLYQSDTPARHGFAEWNYPPDATGAVGGVAAVGGTIYGMRIDAQSGQSISNIVVVCGGAAVALTAGQCIAVIIDGTTGDDVARNADISGLFGSSGVVTIPVPAFTPVLGRAYAVLLLFNGTTPPSLVRSGATGNIASNAGLTGASPRRYFNAGTGQSAIPSNVNLATTSASGAFTYWCALS